MHIILLDSKLIWGAPPPPPPPPPPQPEPHSSPTSLLPPPTSSYPHLLHFLHLLNRNKKARRVVVAAECLTTHYLFWDAFPWNLVSPPAHFGVPLSFPTPWEKNLKKRRMAYCMRSISYFPTSLSNLPIPFDASFLWCRPEEIGCSLPGERVFLHLICWVPLAKCMGKSQSEEGGAWC